LQYLFLFGTLFAIHYKVIPELQFLFSGNPKLLGIRAYGAFATIACSLVVTFVILKVINVVVGLRVDAEAEVESLDPAEYSEAGYTIWRLHAKGDELAR